jgi:hypothetical protein
MIFGSQRKSWSSRNLLLLFLIIGLLPRVYDGMRFADRVHQDEIFQTLEPAHRLAFGFGVISWEWRDGVRSWVFPAILAVLMRATAWTGPGFLGYLRGISTSLSLLSLTTIWFGFTWARRAIGMDAAVVTATACACWYQLVLFAARPLNEVLAAHILLPGLYLGVYASGLHKGKKLFLASALCGLAASFRIQLAPAVVFAILYFCRRNWRACLPIATSGFLLPVAVFGLVDALT